MIRTLSKVALFVMFFANFLIFKVKTEKIEAGMSTEDLNTESRGEVCRC